MRNNELRPKRSYPSLFDLFSSSGNHSVIPHQQSWVSRLLHGRILDDGNRKATAAQVDAQVETAEMVRDAQVDAARERIAVMTADVRHQCAEEMLKVTADALERIFHDSQTRLDEIATRKLPADKKAKLIALIEKHVALALKRIDTGTGDDN